MDDEQKLETVGGILVLAGLAVAYWGHDPRGYLLAWIGLATVTVAYLGFGPMLVMATGVYIVHWQHDSWGWLLIVGGLVLGAIEEWSEKRARAQEAAEKVQRERDTKLDDILKRLAKVEDELQELMR